MNQRQKIAFENPMARADSMPHMRHFRVGFSEGKRWVSIVTVNK